MKINILVAAVALSFSGAALAGPTCADSTEIFSDSTVSGDTCTSGNAIGALGPLPSPHNDVIYHFVAQGASASISVPASDYDYGVFLTSGCAGTTPAPTQAVTSTDAPGTAFPVNGLVDGNTYYIIVSGNPGVDTPSCGTYTVEVTGQLPVELESFSID